MGQISFKAIDTSYKPADVAKKGKDTSDVTEDFKTLLEGKREDKQDVPKEPEGPGKETGETSGGNAKDMSDTAADKDKESTGDIAGALQGLQADPALLNMNIVNIQEFMADVSAFTESLGTQASQADGAADIQMAAPVSEAAQELQAASEGASNAGLEQGNSSQLELPKAGEEVLAAETGQGQKTVTQDSSTSKETTADTGSRNEALAQAVSNQAAQGEKKGSESLSDEGAMTDARNQEQAAVITGGQAAAVAESHTEVKTEPAATISVPQPEELPEKLTEQILAKAVDGVKEFEIQIEPKNLGKIAVKILYEAGQTIVSILCSEKKTLDMLGNNAREIGHMMDQNLGGTTTVIVEKPETDYLQQGNGENDHTARDSEQDRQKEESQKQKANDAEQFLQKLRLGLNLG